MISSNISRRVFVLLALVAALGIGITIWLLQSGTAAEDSIATATRGDLVVSVGGVGRIVEAGASSQPIVPPAVGGGTAASASPGTSAPSGPATSGAGAGAGAALAPTGAVFPRANGYVSRFLVAPGQRVVAGQALALLSDGGLVAGTRRQAQNDLATALLELRQKRTSDPLKGVPPTPEELAAGRLAVTAARERLARLLLPPRRADVSAARLAVKRAQEALELVVGGTPAARAEAVRIARRNVQLAQQRLAQILAPMDPVEVSAATAELRKAEADLAALLRPPAGPLPEEIAAAQRAVTVAKENLADAQAAVPPDPAAIRAAQLELDRAVAELAVLLRPPAAPSAEEIAAARAAVEAARRKLVKLLSPPSPADVTAARLELERARAELRALEAGPSHAALAAAREAVYFARARLAQLFGPSLRTDITPARLDLRRAQADLAVLRARGGPGSWIDVAFARLKVRAARAQLASARLAERLLTVRAPSDGTVTALLTVNGAPVDVSTPIVAVNGLDRLGVSIDLSEFDVARVRRGMRAVVSVDALGGKSFPAKVLFAALMGNDNGGTVTFPVRLGLTRAAGLRPGMNVSVRIIVAERHDVVQVPVDAVSHDAEDRPFATVINGSGDTSTRKLKLGLANNKSVEVESGLRDGERVVLAASQDEGGEEG